MELMFTVECMNMKPHGAHTWREGFLWLRKKTCKGMPIIHNWDEKPDARVNDYIAADVMMTSAMYNRLYHRHHFQLVESNRAFLTWECKDCPDDVAYVQARFVWVSQTVYGRRLDDNPWEVWYSKFEEVRAHGCNAVGGTTKCIGEDA